MSDVDLTEADWIETEEVQALIKWLENCTLAELIMAKEIIEKQRGSFQ
jgi:hypothetical protein